LTASAPRCGALPAGIKAARFVGSMGPPDTPSVGWRRPLGASVKPLRYLKYRDKHQQIQTSVESVGISRGLSLARNSQLDNVTPAQ
jgi:hypothetical protein